MNKVGRRYNSLNGEIVFYFDKLFGKPLLNYVLQGNSRQVVYVSDGGATVSFIENRNLTGVTISGLEEVVNLCEYKLKEIGVKLERLK